MDDSRLKHVKDRLRTTWITGDFGQIARYTEKCAAEFVDRLNPQPGQEVLDVACGTGNLAIPAARAGGKVRGIDIALNLLEQGRSRADAESLPVEFSEGDAESLAFDDAAFDLVMSMFGAMFAPRPDVAVGEMARVCRPGGKIAMANWTPEGFTGRMFALGAQYIPPPEGIPAPVQWGNEAMATARLLPYSNEIQTRKIVAPFDFPFPPRDVVAFFRKYFGPVQVAFSRLPGPAGAAYEEDLIRLWSDHNEAGAGSTYVASEFLEVVAIRA